MDYKDTLNMPKTDFEMRGNLAKKEPGILEQWEKADYYNQILAHHKGQQAYVLHDGPPYANGNLHAGTAMNRCIKDFITRSHAMSGYYTPFFPGWDTEPMITAREAATAFTRLRGITRMKSPTTADCPTGRTSRTELP